MSLKKHFDVAVWIHLHFWMNYKLNEMELKSAVFLSLQDEKAKKRMTLWNLTVWWLCVLKRCFDSPLFHVNTFLTKNIVLKFVEKSVILYFIWDNFVQCGPFLVFSFFIHQQCFDDVKFSVWVHYWPLARASARTWPMKPFDTALWIQSWFKSTPVRCESSFAVYNQLWLYRGSIIRLIHT